MALADDFDALERSRTGPVCSVAIAWAAMDAKDQAALLAAFANSGLPSTGIARVLRANGYTVSDGAVQRHRRKTCRCP